MSCLYTIHLWKYFLEFTRTRIALFFVVKTFATVWPVKWGNTCTAKRTTTAWNSAAAQIWKCWSSVLIFLRPSSTIHVVLQRRNLRWKSRECHVRFLLKTVEIPVSIKLDSPARGYNKWNNLPTTHRAATSVYFKLFWKLTCVIIDDEILCAVFKWIDFVY